MATTTPNYGWTVPTSTDLVKDGATAIETLGDAIDASMNTALGTKKAGMVLLNTTSFSAVASQSFNNVFSASYKKYKFIGNILQAGATSCIFRLRASGTDASGSNYVRVNYLLGAAAITPQGGTGTSFSLADDTASRNIFVDLDLYDPFGTVNTNILYNTGISGAAGRNGNVLHNLTTSYDGFSIIAGISTISGEISVYGYNE
jgi:hypothetical protein